MSEDFIDRARNRIATARTLLSVPVISEKARAELIAMLPIVEAVVDAVGRDGSLPGALCTAVVKYGAKP